MRRVQVIDSHTCGEPTRVVVSGGPELGGGSIADRLAVFRERYDRFRSAVVNEPRGSDVLVGALLCEAADATCAAGAIFFNNVGYLGMCGHGTMGLAVTLAHLGRIGAGEHRIQTPVGVVTVSLRGDGSVAVENVPSFRKAKDISVNVHGAGTIRGDVAWGGNWFFLAEAGKHLEAGGLQELTELAWRIRQAVNARGFPEVDHIELFGPASRPGADSQNFVLCPGRAFDRSPCGTGTSAKLACLAADGELEEDRDWVQDSIIGSSFTARYRWMDRSAGTIAPTIAGRAYVNSEAALILDESDPYCWGIR